MIVAVGTTGLGQVPPHVPHPPTWFCSRSCRQLLREPTDSTTNGFPMHTMSGTVWEENEDESIYRPGPSGLQANNQVRRSNLISSTMRDIDLGSTGSCSEDEITVVANTRGGLDMTRSVPNLISLESWTNFSDPGRNQTLIGANALGEARTPTV